MKKLFSMIPILLLVIVIIAGVLRFYDLGIYPAGFHIDEASLGYNGYSILKTGKDEHGNRFPIYIDMFGDNRPSGYHYLTVLPIAIFGLNEFSTRFPGALFGTLSVLSLYYLVFALFRDKKIALLSSLLMAISPWHIVSSRASSESLVAVFFIVTGFACIVRSFRKNSVGLLITGFISLIVSFQFYHTPRVFVPLIVISVLFLFFRKLKVFRTPFVKTTVICCAGLALISFLLVFFVKGGTGRFSQVSIFGSPATSLLMQEQIREDGMLQAPSVISRTFHNKIINYSYTFISNYLDYFSGKFLFISGGRPLWYKIPNIGMLYLFELPFLIIGFITLFIQKNPLLKLPFVWLLLAPLVGSITTDDIPNIQRVMVMFPMLEVMTAYGILQVISKFKSTRRTIVISVVCLGFLLNSIYFLHQYVVHGTSHESMYRFNGFKEMVLAVRDELDQFDSVVMTKTSGGIYPHVLFFMKYDPATYQKEGSPKDPDFSGFGKFMFTPQFCPSINGDDRYPKTGITLYVDSGTCNISPLIKQKRILKEDGTTAFILVYPPGSLK